MSTQPCERDAAGGNVFAGGPQPPSPSTQPCGRDAAGGNVFAGSPQPPSPPSGDGGGSVSITGTETQSHYGKG